MYSSYLQIQIAKLKTGIRVLYIILLQSALHRISFSGTDSDVLQAKCHQSILCGLSNIFQQYIDFVNYVKVSKEGEKWKTRFDLTHFFQSLTLLEDALPTMRPQINVYVISLCLWARQKKTRFCADQTVNKGMMRVENIQCRVHLKHYSALICLSGADRRFSSFTFFDSHTWDGWGEMIKDP